MKKKGVILLLALSTYLGQAMSNFNTLIENVIFEKIVVVNPFCATIVQGYLEMFKKLITLGKDINQNLNGKTPLQNTARYNRSEIAKLLLEKEAKLNAKSDMGYMALT